MVMARSASYGCQDATVEDDDDDNDGVADAVDQCDPDDDGTDIGNDASDPKVFLLGDVSVIVKYNGFHSTTLP